MELTTSEYQLIRKIVLFYQNRHMSARNPQWSDINAILDKITKGLTN